MAVVRYNHTLIYNSPSQFRIQYVNCLHEWTQRSRRGGEGAPTYLTKFRARCNYFHVEGRAVKPALCVRSDVSEEVLVAGEIPSNWIFLKICKKTLKLGSYICL